MDAGDGDVACGSVVAAVDILAAVAEAGRAHGWPLGDLARIVLDAVDGPAAPPSAAPALAAWFAESSAASELVLIGADRLEGAALPVRVLDVDTAEIA